MDCFLTSDMFLFRSRLICASSLLDIDNQLLLCLILVYRPCRVVHLIVDIKSTSSGTRPASEPGQTIRELRWHGSEEKPTFAVNWRPLQRQVRGQGERGITQSCESATSHASSLIITGPQISHVFLPACPPASLTVVQTPCHPPGEADAMVAAETTSPRALQAQERILDHPNYGHSRHRPIFHIRAWDMAVETAQMENRPH
jgi:hypothetical protein